MGEGIVLLDDYTVHKDLISGKLVRLLPDYQVTNSKLEDGMYATIIDSPAIPTKVRLFLDFVASRASGPEKAPDFPPTGRRETSYAILRGT